MAITSEIVGKLGGGNVEVIPVEGEASGRSGSSEVIATIDVPAGETWLVAAIGQVTPANASLRPWLHLGDNISGRPPAGETYGLVTITTEPISLSLKRESSSGVDSYTGHAYAVKL